MKKMAVAILAVLTLLTGFSTVEAGELKVGVVFIQRVFKEYTYAQQQEAAIKEQFKGHEKEINDLAARIESAKQAIRPRLNLAEEGDPTVRIEMMKIQMDQVRLDHLRKTFRKNFRFAMANFYRSIYQDFQAAVKALAQKEQFDLILTAPEPSLSDELKATNAPEAIQNEILLRRVQHVSGQVDLTDRVIVYMNQLRRGK